MRTNDLPPQLVDRIIDGALAEDAGRGDITSEVLIPCNMEARATVLIKEAGILAGIHIADRVLQTVDNKIQTEILIQDGQPVARGDIALLARGNLRSLLKAERVALNFLQRMSGIASTTARYVALVKDLGVDIADTRKTTPGLRVLEKYAVLMGGGRNHRTDLGDAILIKDNHFAALRASGLSYPDIIVMARESAPEGITVEAEATTIEEAVAATAAGIDIVMLDNMTNRDMTRAVELIAGRAEVEASGGFNLQNIRAAAETGVDYISVGALTHSYQALDISLEIEPLLT